MIARLKLPLAPFLASPTNDLMQHKLLTHQPKTKMELQAKKYPL